MVHLRVRKATLLDGSDLLKLMQRYHSEMPSDMAGVFDVSITAERIMQAIDAPDHFQCIALDGSKPVGCIAAALAPMRYWSHEFVACDIVLYVLPEYRARGAGLKLIRAYEEWARSMGCRHITLSCSSRINEDRTYKLYERLGYNSLGVQFIKEL